MADAQLAGPAPEPTTRPAHPTPFCEVNGQPVDEFRALIDGQAGAIITASGSWVFGRVYFCPGPKGTQFEGKPGFDLGDGHSRVVAGQRVCAAKFDTSEGLWVYFSDYTAFIPALAIKASWKHRP